MAANLAIVREGRCRSCNERLLPCQVCRLIAARREERELRDGMKALAAAAKNAPIKTLYDIKLVGKEKTKPERYTIKCSRCAVRLDPTKTIMVGDVCESCWYPHEIEANLESHRTWARPPKKTDLSNVQRLEEQLMTAISKATEAEDHVAKIAPPTAFELADKWLRKRATYKVAHQDGYDIVTISLKCHDKTRNEACLRFQIKYPSHNQSAKEAAIVGGAARLQSFLEEFADSRLT